MRSNTNFPSLILISLQLLLANFVTTVDGEEICVELVARFEQRAPDGVHKEVITINNQFPGPTIRAKLHDTLTIRVRNALRINHSTSVHFHGIEMRYTPWFDGPEQVTQCPIPFGGYMDYKFKLMQTGTYWYHSHHTWQYVDGFWGLLIVDNTPEVYAYQDELTFTLTDWHWRTGEVLSNYLHSPRNPSNPLAGQTPLPDSALVNGFGIADCDLATSQHFVCDREAANVASVFSVREGLTYRVRVINPSARAAFNFSIDGHFLRTIEVDGVDTVEAGGVDVVTIWPAQRYSFLVTMNRKNWGGRGGNFRVRTDMVGMVVRASDQDRIQRIQPFVVLHYDATSLWTARSFSPLPATSEFQLSLGQSLFTTRAPPSVTASSFGGGIQGRPTTSILLPESRILSVNNASIFSLGDLEESRREIPMTRNFPWCGFLQPTVNQDKSLVRINRDYITVQSNRPWNARYLNQLVCRAIKIPGAYDDPPKVVHQQVVLNATFGVNTRNFFKGHINGNAYDTSVSQTPAIFRTMMGQSIPSTFNPQLTSHLHRVVQIVINNLNQGPHPWHLHGHTFWVLGTGQPDDGAFNPIRDSWKLSPTGVRRDTTHTPENSWTVVRYVTDNPGVWLLHCHIHWHLEVGLGAVFVEGPEELRNYYRIPEEARRVCSLNGIDIPRFS